MEKLELGTSWISSIIPQEIPQWILGWYMWELQLSSELLRAMEKSPQLQKVTMARSQEGGWVAQSRLLYLPRSEN